MQDLMIDIETLGTGNNAVMIQLGACYFDRRTGKIGDTFCRSINREKSTAAGFEEDQSTIDWWSRQDQTIFQEIISSRESPKQVMNAFRSFADRKNVKFWSHATFDFVIVQNHFKKLGIKPLPHGKARDIRTLVDISGINLSLYNWGKKTHNALDDCKFQVEYCRDAFNSFLV